MELANLTALEALEEIQRQLSGVPDDVPDGWMTDAQWSEASGICRTVAGERLRGGVAKGLVEVKNFRIMTTAGIRPRKHYRVK